MNRGRGFTLVELIVVIVVIAILATLATFGINRYLQDARDTERSANVSTIAEALEKYYDENGEYPSCGAVTAPGTDVTTNTLKGLDGSALLVPSPTSGVTNSITCGTTLNMTSTGDFFEYVGDGSADCTGASSCLTYTIRYRSESENVIKEIKSRRVTDFATSGQIRNLAISNLSYKTLNLGWGSVQNVTGYSIQQATNDDFTAGLTTYSSTNSSLSITGLTQGTQYFFRVMPVGSLQQGGWSNVAEATALALSIPTLSLTGTTGTSATVGWTATQNADANTRYVVQRATNTGFTTGLVTSPATASLTHTATGLAAGTTYYFRVKAQTTTITPTYETAYSNTITSAIKPVTPTGVAATVNSATQITVNWSAVSGVTDYIVRYGTSSGALSSTTAATTSTSIAVTGLLQGQPYYFQVYSRQGATESDPSAMVNGTTPINAPAAFSTSAWVDQGQSLYATANSTCPAGTSYMYHWYANGGFWVGGSEHRTVGYWLNWNQSVTLHPAARCEKGGVVSGWTWASNTVSHSRPGMNLSMWLGPDMCAGGFCGRQLNSAWNNVCGSGAPRIYARQLSAYANWVADSPSNDSLLFKGASSPGVWVDYYDINIGCTSAAGSIQVISAYKCNGCS